MARVFFVAPSAYPLGGVAVWLDYIAKGLPAFGWEPVIGLVSGRWHDVSRYTEAFPTLPWVTIENSTGSAEGRQRALAAAIHEQKADVIVGVNIADVYSACHRLRRNTHKPFKTVMALHGIASDLLGDLEMMRGCIDAVIGTNRLTCQLCSELAGMSSDHVHYAPYGVDLESLTVNERTRPEGRALRIAYVGRLDNEQKRVDLIPEILAHLEEEDIAFHIDIAGDGPKRESLRASLEPWIADGRATMLGSVPADMLVDRVYGQCDVLLVTSSWETGPIVIWEAMAAGVPVVTSRYIGSGLEGALVHGENCLTFPVGDAGQAAQNLQDLTITDKAKKLSIGGRQLIAERYSIERSVEAWAAALDRIVESVSQQGDCSTIVPRVAGRLDRIFGTSGAETFRKLVGLSFNHGSAGGEWPHSLTGRSNQARLESYAKAVDDGTNWKSDSW